MTLGPTVFLYNCWPDLSDNGMDTRGNCLRPRVRLSAFRSCDQWPTKDLISLGDRVIGRTLRLKKAQVFLDYVAGVSGPALVSSVVSSQQLPLTAPVYKKIYTSSQGRIRWPKENAAGKRQAGTYLY